MSDGPIFFFSFAEEEFNLLFIHLCPVDFCPYKLNGSIHRLGVSGLGLFV